MIDRDKQIISTWVKVCMISFPSSYIYVFAKSHLTGMCCAIFIIENFDILKLYVSFKYFK